MLQSDVFFSLFCVCEYVFFYYESTRKKTSLVEAGLLLRQFLSRFVTVADNTYEPRQSEIQREVVISK